MIHGIGRWERIHYLQVRYAAGASFLSAGMGRIFGISLVTEEIWRSRPWAKLGALGTY